MLRSLPVVFCQSCDETPSKKGLTLSFERTLFTVEQKGSGQGWEAGWSLGQSQSGELRGSFLVSPVP